MRRVALGTVSSVSNASDRSRSLVSSSVRSWRIRRAVSRAQPLGADSRPTSSSLVAAPRSRGTAFGRGPPAPSVPTYRTR